jgi:NAD+ kinase
MNPKINRVGVILKKQDPRVASIVEEIVPWFYSRGVEVYLDQYSVERYPKQASIAPPGVFVRQVDVVIVFGGDGTLLYAARLVGTSGIPILGINLGSLGFLTEVKLDKMHEAFEVLLSGLYQLEERILLDVEVLREGRVGGQYLALNDAVINKHALARIIDLEVSVNSEPVLHTRADGLIISTPTGSTAYSLAAGGPILYPKLDAIIIAPICPHTLTNRPLVIPDRESVEVCLRRGAEVMLTVDGQVGMSLQQQDSVRIRRAQSTLRLILPSGNNFFKLLREKLRWG